MQKYGRTSGLCKRSRVQDWRQRPLHTLSCAAVCKISGLSLCHEIGFFFVRRSLVRRSLVRRKKKFAEI
jgi:hypothetical protein